MLPCTASAKPARRCLSQPTWAAGSAAHDLSTIGVEHLAGHAYSVVGGEENIAGRDLVRFGRPTEEAVLAELRDMFGRERGRNQRRPDRARRDGVDPDPALLEIFGERARERDDSALGRRVVD